MEKLARPLREADYMALKGATRRLVERCGGLESAAAVTRAGFPTISKYGRPQEPVFIPVDVLADLEVDAGEPVVTRALAALAGHVLVPLPQAGSGSGPWWGHISDIAKGAGEVVRRLGVALEDDGDMSAEEIRKLALREALQTAITDLVELDHALAARDEGKS